MYTVNHPYPSNFLFSKAILKLVLLFLFMVMLQACSGRYVTSYNSLKPEATNNYCQADQLGTEQTVSMEELEILENKQRIKDETTIGLMLKSAAFKIVKQAESTEVCERIFKQGTALFNQLIKQNQQNLASEKGFKPAKDASILKAQQRITDLWREDQSARATLVGLMVDDTKDTKFWANRLASAHTIRADIEATEYLEGLLNQYDWIDQQRFGVPVSAHAWILIQHADDRVDLQTEVLKRMLPYFENGGIRPANYAYLWDRVAVNTGLEQRYGTQPFWECKDGKLELQPIENRSVVNQLRETLGMNTVEAGLAEMSQSVCGGK